MTFVPSLMTLRNIEQFEDLLKGEKKRAGHLIEYYSSRTEMQHWAIPFFVHTPLWMVLDFRPDFFSFCIMEGSGFSIKIAISSIPYTGFCVCKGYGWPGISGKFCGIIHTLVGFEQSIFCLCLDFS